MNRNQKIVLAIGLVLVVLVLATAPYYRPYGQYGQIKVRVEPSDRHAQMDIGQTLIRILVVCLLTGGVMWILKSSQKGEE